MTEIAERAAELARELAGPGALEPVVVVVVLTRPAVPVPDGLADRPPWEELTSPTAAPGGLERPSA